MSFFKRLIRVAICLVCALSMMGAFNIPSSFADDIPKVDCGYLGIDKEVCEATGCIWEPVETTDPWCYYNPEDPDVFTPEVISCLENADYKYYPDECIYLSY